ncbi:MAG: glycine zipper 2TM domain-containing protein [Sphingomonas sp.]|uniref:glycine zipper 2TM domain-containing protein n=1 Tax=Sphingomonas sp. TaxID=28214 RepID=UPI001B172E24|nr:glycine zipper 2TM domain-containing protein [Sphingomonas sp.]MBO9621201.1 glycine zipper 2TM domain-containing protein [Sphingomonas sp.]
MRILLAATLAAVALPAVPVTAASAAPAMSATAYAPPAQHRRVDRDWRRYRNYDYNRLPRGQRSYFADDYYRDGRFYRERRLSRNDRIYRGRNGRYYCRRTDGTTGLLLGAGIGALLGNSLSYGRSDTIGTLLGAAAGASLGAAVDRGQVRCR